MSITTRRPPATTPRRTVATDGGAASGRPPLADPRRDRYTGSIRTSLLLLIGLGIAVAGLGSLLDGRGWFALCLVVMAVVFGSAALTRVLVRPRFVATLVAAVLALVAVTVIFASDTAIVGLVPTAETWQRFRDLSQAGAASINEQAIPAEAVDGIRFILVWATAAIAVIVDAAAIWWRIPAFAGLPMLVILTVPSTVDGTLANPLYFVAAAIVYLLLLRPRLRRIQASVAVGIGAVTVGLALLAPLVLPAVPDAGGSGLNGAVSAGINPIITLGNDLRRGAPTTALTYTSALDQGQYLRLTTLQEFRGKEWAPVSVDPIPGNDVSAIGAAPGLGADVVTISNSTTVDVKNSVGRWLPVPYPATKVTGLKGNWFWEPDGLSVRTVNANMRGQEYTVDSLVLEPTSDQLEAAGDSSFLPLAQVPNGLDPVVAETAAQVVGDAATDYDKAIALQSWFRGGEFTYSEEAPVEEGFDGSGLDVLVPFLQAKTGYCVHFASAMAVMARTLGIPSRVVVGFLPGDASTNVDGLSTYTVSSRDLHSWPELYFEGTGWVRFEPTPGRGIVPSYLAANVDNPATPDVNEAQPSTAPTATAPTTAPLDVPNDPSNSASSTGSAAAATGIRSALVTIGILALLFAAAAARLGIRSARYGAVRRGNAPAAAAWQEVVDTARDLGFVGLIPDTPRDLAAALERAGAAAGAALAPLASLRVAVEREIYAPAAAARVVVSADDLRLVLRGIRRRAGWPARLRAALIPRTILDRIMALPLRFARA